MICVLGGGSWGTALAHVLACAGHEVPLIVRNAEQAQAINTEHQNTRYIPGLLVHPGVRATTDHTVLGQADLVVLAVPTQSQRQALTEVKHLIGRNTVLVNASKGIELGSLSLLSQVVEQVFESDLSERYAVLSGPSFAREVLECKPTAVVLGCQNTELGERLRELFGTPWFRAYSSTDVRGVEVGGAVKNVIAIATGVSDGLHFGDNTRAALVTRGLAEISRLGQVLGARANTFMGLSGLGDLMLTCAGDLSRNRQVGLHLGQGQSLPEIIASMNMVAEGVKTTEAVDQLARKLQVEMPITATMNALMHGRISPQEALILLMQRTLKSEEQG